MRCGAVRMCGPGSGHFLPRAVRWPTPWPGQRHGLARTCGHRPDRRSGQLSRYPCS